ncbi:MAG: hypothetical protein KAJ40_05815 [Alphaproteobacteria bacterium]|nr:hypothetical protein [Alphaproteobacteria bacterium]
MGKENKDSELSRETSIFFEQKRKEGPKEKEPVDEQKQLDDLRNRIECVHLCC